VYRVEHILPVISLKQAASYAAAPASRVGDSSDVSFLSEEIATATSQFVALIATLQLTTSVRQLVTCSYKADRNRPQIHR